MLDITTSVFLRSAGDALTLSHFLGSQTIHAAGSLAPGPIAVLQFGHREQCLCNASQFASLERRATHAVLDEAMWL